MVHEAVKGEVHRGDIRVRVTEVALRDDQLRPFDLLRVEQPKIVERAVRPTRSERASSSCVIFGSSALGMRTGTGAILPPATFNGASANTLTTLWPWALPLSSHAETSV
jgi:hypothetical protein